MTPANLLSVIPDSLPAPVAGALGRLIGLDRLQGLYDELRALPDDRGLAARLLTHLRIDCRVSNEDLERIPREGPVVVVANHPFGILEAAVLVELLAPLRPDVKFLANHVLTIVPEIRDLLIEVDPFGGPGSMRANRAGLKRAIEHLRAGGMLVVFPAGEVSHFRWRERAVADPEWSPSVARLIGLAEAAVVPLYVQGANSALFQALGMLHPRLRTAMLVRELLNKSGARVSVRIGSPIPAAKLAALPTSEEQTRYLRWRTYLLAHRRDYKPETSRPLRSRKSGAEPVVEPVPAERMAAEIDRLAPAHLLAASGELAVFLASAREIPETLREIGRLREITFRAAGEGTGRAIDLDAFDWHYRHLFVWNTSTREVAGAYRLAHSDTAPRLYTSTLFHYDEKFLETMGPAIELGRSFVRAEYQRAFAPLLLLWKGIGRYVARQPRYKVLFGPVTISSRYHAVSRELMVSFLQRHAWLDHWGGVVAGRNPPRARTGRTGLDLDDLSQVVGDIEPGRTGVPVLLRQYLKLGGKLLGFHIDRQFAGALDGLILVDLTQTEPRLLERYLGKEEARRFLAFHRSQETNP